MPATTPEQTFDWDNDDSVVVARQMAIAVLQNERGDVVIRQESQDPHEDEAYVLVRPENVPALIDALCAAAGYVPGSMPSAANQ